MSVRASTGAAPVICSGDMNCNLPLRVPGCVLVMRVSALAMPKSVMLAGAVGADQDVLRRDVAVHEVERDAVVVASRVRGVQALERVDDAPRRRAPGVRPPDCAS